MRCARRSWRPRRSGSGRSSTPRARTRSRSTWPSCRPRCVTSSRARPASRWRCPATRCPAGCVGLVRGAFLERAQALPAAPDAGQLLRVLAGDRGGGPAARGRLVAALHRPALGARRARAGGRGGARPSLAAHLDPLPGRDAAARPERRGQSGAGAPARTDLQRRLRAQLRGQRRDRAGARRRPAGGSRSDPVLGHRHPRVGARHRPADRGGEEPHACGWRRPRPISASAIRWR